MKWNSGLVDKWYAVATFLCIGGFFLPSMRLVIAGEPYTQWFLGTYGGKVVFVNLLVFSLLVQGFFYARYKKPMPWIGLLAAVYLILYTGNQLWKCLIRFKTNRPLTLVDKLQPECYPLAGVWLLIAAGILLLIVSAIKIVSNSLSAKKVPGSQAELPGTHGGA